MIFFNEMTENKETVILFFIAIIWFVIATGLLIIKEELIQP